jgi:hypothetical protein
MSPRLWTFEGAHVGQASRLPSSDLQSQAGRPRHISKNLKQPAFGISRSNTEFFKRIRPLDAFMPKKLAFH